ncbi:hypothetical protein C2G38_2256625 [Gigaspora rosea]|uniref:Uncharacterized protein n=1 Tax=Gigaspora rosea TaxID=44941 RepID=A0A397TPR6_9GLOM|nr:hypothetical protein C2G38_2256827 [Gigaspora rosea]RIB00559.1 hypothetical protein C2G38_2256625 [Gigaspora rosea]
MYARTYVHTYIFIICVSIPFSLREKKNSKWGKTQQILKKSLELLTNMFS